MSCTGRWQVGDGRGDTRDADGNPLLLMLVSENASGPMYGLEPDVAGKGKSLTFYWTIGNPTNDDNYVFTR